jgi:hypothetical protein
LSSEITGLIKNTQRGEGINYPQRAFWLLVGLAAMYARPHSGVHQCALMIPKSILRFKGIDQWEIKRNPDKKHNRQCELQMKIN